MIDFSGSIEFLLAFVSAILGLSVPVMLQVIERVDQRYESTRLAERLKREPIVKSCIYQRRPYSINNGNQNLKNFSAQWMCGGVL